MVPITPDQSKRLLYAKHMLGRAAELQGKRSELLVSESLLLLHDASEMVMQVVYEHHHIKPPHEFMKFWDAILQAGLKRPGFYSQLRRRNAVNYRHEMGCWYPFRYGKVSYGNLHDHARGWTRDPLKIDLSVGSESDLRAFQNTCHFIVALCRELTEELAVRTVGKSFTTYRPIVVLNLAGVAAT